jgi:hypothetical protein
MKGKLLMLSVGKRANHRYDERVLKAGYKQVMETFASTTELGIYQQ